MSEPTGFGMVPNMPGRLTPYEIAVYVALTWRTSFDTGSCWPSHKSIAEDACMSEASVKRALAGLREKGLVTWEQRRDSAGDLTSNVYRVRAVGGGVSQSPPGVQAPGVGSVRSQGGVPQSEELDPMNQNQVPLTSDVPSNGVVAVIEGVDKRDARVLAEYLSERLADLDIPASKRVVTEAWVTEIRRMIQRDGRSPDSIRKAIDWAMADSFWSGNIHSPAALRRGYDKMRLQAQRRPSGRDSQQAAVADEAALTGRAVEDVRADHMATIAATAALASRRTR